MTQSRWSNQVEDLGEETFTRIRHDYGRKCGEWTECHSEPTLKVPHDVLNQLKTVYLPADSTPFDELPDSVVGIIFVANVGGTSYLVNTEGHTYSRYICRVKAE